MHHEILHGEQFTVFGISDFIEQFDGIGFRCCADGGKVTVLPAADVEGHMGAPCGIIGGGEGAGHGWQQGWLEGMRMVAGVVWRRLGMAGRAGKGDLIPCPACWLP
jgi:hypothetical protein